MGVGGKELTDDLGVSYGWDVLQRAPPPFEHLIADLHGCKARVVRSPDAIQNLLVRAAKAADLKIVHEFCRPLFPQGSSHVVIVKESHLSAHVWPETRYVSVDIFVCNGRAAEVLNVIENDLEPRKREVVTLGRGRSLRVSCPTWLIERVAPGFDSVFRGARMLHRQASEHQLIEIAEHPRFGRMLFLDGDLQATTGDEGIYHSHLVQPAMLLHEKPASVLLLGGGDGGALREILRHGTVRRVDMVEIDEAVVEACKTHLPSINDGAFLDPRVTLHYADAVTFDYEESLYDIVIVDFPDPDAIKIDDPLRFLTGLRRTLRPDGILAAHGGSLAFQYGVPWQSIRRSLRRVFHRVSAYATFVPSFGSPWVFLLASDSRGPTSLSPQVLTAARRRKNLPAKVLRTSETIFIG